MIEVPDNDIEYYERKVMRMEQDICLLQQELGRVRMRLRTAEDFQIKYRILTKNNDVDIQRIKIQTARTEENKFKDKIAQALKENDEHWAKSKQMLQQELRKQSDKKLQQISGELEQAIRRIKQLSQKKEEMELFSFKIRKFEKQNDALQLQLSDIKAVCERQKNEQIASLRNQLNTAFRQKLNNQRQNYQNKITLLTKQLAQTQVQQDTIELRLPQLNNSELVNVKDLYASSKLSHEKEISQLEEIIMRKNTEIKALLREQSQRQQNFQSILTNKNKALDLLQKTILELKKQNQEEVIELTHRITASKQAQAQIFKEQLKNLNELVKAKEKQLDQQRRRHSQQSESLNHRFNQDILRISQQKEQAQRQIGQLNRKLKQKQENIAELYSQINHEKSNKNKQNSQQDEEYQNGIIFLQHQLRHCEQRLKQKVGVCIKLESDFKDYKQGSEKQKEQLKNQLKNYIKRSEEEISELEGQIRDLTDQLIAKNTQIGRIKQSFLSEKLHLQVQNRSLKSDLEELEDDYKRLQQSKNILQAQGRKVALQEPQQSFNHFENELTTIYREKQQALLRRQDQNKKQANQVLRRLQQKLSKVERQNAFLKSRQNQHYQKQNIQADNVKKIASVDLELALINNIYHQFVTSKSHNGKQLSP